MKDYNEFTFQTPRTLPIVMLLDTSGSMMEDCKIDELTNSVNEMVNKMKELDDPKASVSLAIFTFGGNPKEFLKLTPIQNVPCLSFEAAGNTPLGGCLKLAKEMIENKDIITSRTYRPVVLLVSDGMPNDDWAPAFIDFKTNGRSSKCYCLSMGIGKDLPQASLDFLQKFSSANEPVFVAKEAKDIHKFFSLVSISVTNRTTSQNPNSFSTVIKTNEQN